MYRILNYTRIKHRSRPPQKKSTYFTHPDFSVAKIGKKVRKLREQIQYFKPQLKKWESNYSCMPIRLSYSQT